MPDRAPDVTHRSGVLPVLGLVVGSQLMVAYLVIGVLTPALPLLLAGATAVSSRSRPFAMGALAAAIGGVVFLITYATARPV